MEASYPSAVTGGLICVRSMHSPEVHRFTARNVNLHLKNYSPHTRLLSEKSYLTNRLFKTFVKRYFYNGYIECLQLNCSKSIQEQLQTCTALSIVQNCFEDEVVFNSISLSTD